MSEPVSTATDVTGTDTGAAKDNLIQAADDHTPETPSPDPVPHADPTDGDSAKNAASDLIESLANRVKTLEDGYATLSKPDAPAEPKSPWTKRGRRRKA